MDDLIAFLRARLDADEQIARACGACPWVANVPGMIHVDPVFRRENKWSHGHLGYVAGVEKSELGDAFRLHISSHHPARVLADVAAKRQIIEEHSYEPGDVTFCRRCSYDDTDDEGDLGRYQEDFPCKTLRLLALPFSGHPDYRKEWTP